MNIKSISTLLCISLVLIASTVSTPAQDSASLEIPLPPESEPRPVKSHLAAYGWMVGGTVLPLMLGSAIGDNELGAALVAGGFLVGPSAGQFYAGSIGPSLLGTGLRTLGSVMIISAALECWLETECDDTRGAMGAVVLFGGLGYSVVDTWFAVDRANKRAMRQQAARYSFAPMLHRNREGRFSPGISLRGSF